MQLDLFSLKGKHALITGAAGLLGEKHAEAICMAGGTPILTDLNGPKLTAIAERLKSQYKTSAYALEMDITSEESVQKIARQLEEMQINVDILINNAARNPAVGANAKVQNSSRFENTNLDELRLDFDVGVSGAVVCAKVFGQRMSKRKKGVIINVASDLGVIAPDQRLYRQEGVPENEQNVKPVGYSIVKHGLVGLTKYLSTYWADSGVRTNCISPGGVFNGQGEEFVSRISKLIPMGRMANANEYQGIIIFLASDASSYMNGANVILDGGRSVW